MTIRLEDHTQVMRFRRRTEHLPYVGRLHGSLSGFQLLAGGLTLGVTLLLTVALVRLGLPFLWGAAACVALPLVAAGKAGQQLPDGRTPKEWLLAHVRYFLLEPRWSYGFEPLEEPIGSVTFSVTELQIGEDRANPSKAPRAMPAEAPPRLPETTAAVSAPWEGWSPPRATPDPKPRVAEVRRPAIGTGPALEPTRRAGRMGAFLAFLGAAALLALLLTVGWRSWEPRVMGNWPMHLRMQIDAWGAAGVGFPTGVALVAVAYVGWLRGRPSKAAAAPRRTALVADLGERERQVLGLICMGRNTGHPPAAIQSLVERGLIREHVQITQVTPRHPSQQVCRYTPRWGVRRAWRRWYRRHGAPVTWPTREEDLR